MVAQMYGNGHPDGVFTQMQGNGCTWYMAMVMVSQMTGISCPYHWQQLSSCVPFVAQMHGIVAQIRWCPRQWQYGCPDGQHWLPKFMAMDAQIYGNGFSGDWQWLPRLLSMVALLYCYCYLDNGYGC